MKQLAIFFITLYQVMFSIIVKHLLGMPAFCRFSPTCSLYTQQMIYRYGILKGGVLGLKRILSCHPFSRYGIVKSNF